MFTIISLLMYASLTVTSPDFDPNTMIPSKYTGKAELEKAMQGHILAQGELVGLYKKSK